MARNPFIPKRATPPRGVDGNKSAGILDDFAVRKNIASREGTIEKVPVNNSDIANKAYVDSLTSDLRDDSMADSLHRHSELSASDGTPNPALSVDANGNVGIGTASPSAKLTVSQVNSASTEGIRVLQGANYLEIYENGAGILQYNGGNYIAIDSGGIGIGTASPSAKLQVAGGVRIGQSEADGNRYSVYWNSVSGGLIFVASDEKLKKDFDRNIGGLSVVNALKPLGFTYKDSNKKQLGFLAQEVIQVHPDLAWHNEEENSYGLNGYDGFIAVLVKAVQELKAEIELLKRR